MSKKALTHKQRNMPQNAGQEVETSLLIDDSFLPPAVELAEYDRVNPNIVQTLLEMTVREQAFRHKSEDARLSAVKGAEKREFRLNWWGMFFAFLIMALGIILSAYLIYSDKTIIGTIFGGCMILFAASIFIRKIPTKQ
jgi:Predicted membrane protein